MASLNQCSFIGNIGKIETRYLPNGDAVTNFSLAVNETWKSKDGEKQEKTEWISCVAFRKLAEIMAEYVKVGASIYASGKIQTRSWEDKEGVKKYTTEIIVDQMQMLGGKREGGDSSEHHSGARQVEHPGSESKPAPATGGGFSDFDDDIHFRESCLHYNLWRVM